MELLEDLLPAFIFQAAINFGILVTMDNLKRPSLRLPSILVIFSNPFILPSSGSASLVEQLLGNHHQVSDRYRTSTYAT